MRLSVLRALCGAIMHNLHADFPYFVSSACQLPKLTNVALGAPPYFDNAATTHKPYSVIRAITDFYTYQNATVHRGIYHAAEEATFRYEQARATVAQYIGADASEIVFVRGATEGINAVAACWAHEHIGAGDEILLTELEHHANLLPWSQLAQRTGAVVRFIPVDSDGQLILRDLSTYISPTTKFVAVTHSSNALGTLLDLAPIIQAAHSVGAKVLVDAAQTAPRQFLDVHAMGADFLVFSGHKMLGPTGSGVLYIRKELHDQLIPYQHGGGMVYEADYAQVTWQKMPYLLEAGTPSIAQAIGLAAAIEYLQENVDFALLRLHEAALCAQLIDGLLSYDRVTIHGPVEQLRSSGHLVSFSVRDLHAHDVAAYLDSAGIAVRAGHHCAQPLALRIGLPATVRASFYCYNTPQEVAYMLQAMGELLKTS
jgi:cysteine desulfurase/selenocysteine lyase